MRKWLWLAWTAVIVMTIVSAAFNFIFGWRIGENSHTISAFFHDGYVYGALSIAADGFKIAFGVLTVAFFMAKGINPALRGLGVMLCGTLWLLSTGYALNSAFGSVATNRTDMAGLREAKSTNYEAIDKQLKHVQQQRDWLEKHRASATLEGEMAKARQSHLWARSGGCSNATITESRSFCQSYFALVAELGTAKRDDELAVQGARLQEQLAASGGKMIADPHARMMHELSGYSEAAIVLGWMLLLVALVEGGSTIGPIALYLVHQNAFRKPVAAAKAPEATGTPAIGSVAVVARSTLLPRQEYKPWVDLGQVSNIQKSNIAPPDDSTPPPADAKPVVEEQEVAAADQLREATKMVKAAAPVARIVVNNDHESLLTIAPERGKKKTNGTGNVKDWLAECSSQSPDKRIKTTSKECHQSYRAWCDIAGLHPVGQKDLARKMSAILGRPAKAMTKGGRAPRDGAGRVWPGLRVFHPSATPLRATA